MEIKFLMVRDNNFIHINVRSTKLNLSSINYDPDIKIIWGNIKPCESIQSNLKWFLGSCPIISYGIVQEVIDRITHFQKHLIRTDIYIKGMEQVFSKLSKGKQFRHKSIEFYRNLNKKRASIIKKGQIKIKFAF